LKFYSTCKNKNVPHFEAQDIKEGLRAEKRDSSYTTIFYNSFYFILYYE